MRKGIAFFARHDFVIYLAKRSIILQPSLQRNNRHVANSDEWQHRSVPNELDWRLMRTSEIKKSERI